MLVKFKRISENAVIPKSSTDGSYGMDLVATEVNKIREDLYLVKFGFSIQFPHEYIGFKIIPRSSISSSGWVIPNSPGLGDSDFTGEYRIYFRAFPNGIDTEWSIHKLTYPEFPYKVGDRVAQCFFERSVDAEFIEVDDLDDTDRGEGGFGHTGGFSKKE